MLYLLIFLYFLIAFSSVILELFVLKWLIILSLGLITGLCLIINAVHIEVGAWTSLVLLLSVPVTFGSIWVYLTYFDGQNNSSTSK